MTVQNEKWEALRKQMEELNIFEKDLDEQFVIGQGKGGQKLQKTASCVLLRHIPSNLTIKCQKTRQREDNRFFARRELCLQYAEKILNQPTSRTREIEKKRKQKKRRARKRSKSDPSDSS